MQMRSSVLRMVGISLVSAAMLAYAGCSTGGSTTGTVFNPPPVQAQTYSNSSLDGTYTVLMKAGDSGAIVSPISFLGALSLDGNGNVSSGTLTEASTPYGGTTATCSVSVTGTYSLSSSATGTANLTLAGNIVSTSANPIYGAIGNGNNCWAVPPNLSMSIMAAQQGQVVAFQMASGATAGFNFAGTGYKQ